MILCGGRGERLRPLTDKIPKPLIKIGNQPVLEHLINILKRNKITEVFLATGFLGEKLEEYFEDGRKWGVNIFYSYEKRPMGGAGAIKLLEDKLDSTFAVLNGDVLTDLNFAKFARFHKEKKALASFIVHKSTHPYDSDLVAVDDDWRVTRFLGKPKRGPKFRNLTKSGAHIFEPEVLQYIPKNKKYSLEEQLLPDLVKKGLRVYAYYTEEYSHDMGTPERLAKVREDFKKGRTNL